MDYGKIKYYEFVFFRGEMLHMKFYKVDDQILVAEGLSVGEELVPNTTDAAGEKHVPVIASEGDTVTVTVGSVEHPMLEAHFIQWIVLEIEGGYQKKVLTPGVKPQAVFKTTDKVIAAYEYCNLHGLWKAEV